MDIMSDSFISNSTKQRRCINTSLMLKNLKQTMNLYGQAASHIPPEEAMMLSQEIISQKDAYDQEMKRQLREEALLKAL